MKSGKDTIRDSRLSRLAAALPVLIQVPLLALAALALTGTAAADIYKYVDKNGVIHFTNTPTSSKFKLYMPEKGNQWRRGHRFSPDSKAYDTIIKKAENRYGVPFALIKAVIRVESGFNPRAVSRKGARGLMQIMPENDQALSLKKPFDPSQNIMAGTRYLKQMLDRYEERLTLALAAYNAGPKAVDKYKKIPPYKETRTYVQKVMTLYNRYKKA